MRNTYGLTETEAKLLIEKGADDLKSARHKYGNHLVACRTKIDAKGVPVKMKMTFFTWLSFWLDSGYWHKRGKHKGEYCMSRVDDLGHYEVGNVFIQLQTDNSSQANLGKRNTASHNRAIAVAFMKPCEVHSVRFKQLKDLRKAYGKGKNGLGHSSFKFL